MLADTWRTVRGPFGVVGTAFGRVQNLPGIHTIIFPFGSAKEKLLILLGHTYSRTLAHERTEEYNIIYSIHIHSYVNEHHQ